MDEQSFDLLCSDHTPEPSDGYVRRTFDMKPSTTRYFSAHIELEEKSLRLLQEILESYYDEYAEHVVNDRVSFALDMDKELSRVIAQIDAAKAERGVE